MPLCLSVLGASRLYDTTQFCSASYCHPRCPLRSALLHSCTFCIQMWISHSLGSLRPCSLCLVVSFSIFSPSNSFKWRGVEGSWNSSRPRCSKLLGGKARFTCSRRWFGMLWGCLGHFSELLQIKRELRTECDSAFEIDQTASTNQIWSWNG